MSRKSRMVEHLKEHNIVKTDEDGEESAAIIAYFEPLKDLRCKERHEDVVYEAEPSEILKVRRQDAPEDLKYECKQRDGIGKYNGEAPVSRQTLTESQGKCPITVPVSEPTEVMLGDISA